jgi:hypothetical protein
LRATATSATRWPRYARTRTKTARSGTGERDVAVRPRPACHTHGCVLLVIRPWYAGPAPRRTLRLRPDIAHQLLWGGEARWIADGPHQPFGTTMSMSGYRYQTSDGPEPIATCASSRNRPQILAEPVDLMHVALDRETLA